jgi:hypothetical protein
MPRIGPIAESIACDDPTLPCTERILQYHEGDPPCRVEIVTSRDRPVHRDEQGPSNVKFLCSPPFGGFGTIDATGRLVPSVKMVTSPDPGCRRQFGLTGPDTTEFETVEGGYR